MDFSDHKVWRLILTVGMHDLRAVFIDSTRRVAVPYVTRRWQGPLQDSLRALEDAVYEDTLLLDDYDTTVLLRPAATLLVPPDWAAERTPEELEEAMSRLDPTEEKDIWQEPMGEAVALYSTPTGIRDFLGRTFPTEDVRHALRPMVEHFTPRAAREGGDKMWAHLGDGRMDICAYRDGRLLEASTHRFDAPMDAAYTLLMAWRTLGMNAEQGELRLSATPEARAVVLPPLRRHIKYVGLTVNASTLSAALREGLELPEAILV